MSYLQITLWQLCLFVFLGKLILGRIFPLEHDVIARNSVSHSFLDNFFNFVRAAERHHYALPWKLLPWPGFATWHLHAIVCDVVIMVLYSLYGCKHNSYLWENCKFYRFCIWAVYSCTRRCNGRVHGPCTRSLYDRVHGPAHGRLHGPVYGYVHGPWPWLCMGRVHAYTAMYVQCTRAYGLCTRLCTRSYTRPVHGRVIAHGRYTAVYTCTRPCTRPYLQAVVCTAVYTAVCMDGVHGRVHGRVHVYTARTWPCTRVHGPYTALHTDRIHVQNRVYGRIEAVYTDRTRVDKCTRPHTGRVQGPYKAVYTRTRQCMGRVHGRYMALHTYRGRKRP